MGKSSKPDVVTPLSCPKCAAPLSKDMVNSRWTVSPLIRDSFSMIGSAVGGISSAFYGFNYDDIFACLAVMPKVQKVIKRPMSLQFLIGAPPVIVFSSACAGLAGGAIPALAQLASSSYHAARSSSSLSPSQDNKNHQPKNSSTL